MRIVTHVIWYLCHAELNTLLSGENLGVNLFADLKKFLRDQVVNVTSVHEMYISHTCNLFSTSGYILTNVCDKTGVG